MREENAGGVIKYVMVVFILWKHLKLAYTASRRLVTISFIGCIWRLELMHVIIILLGESTVHDFDAECKC